MSGIGLHRRLAVVWVDLSVRQGIRKDTISGRQDKSADFVRAHGLVVRDFLAICVRSEAKYPPSYPERFNDSGSLMGGWSTLPASGESALFRIPAQSMMSSETRDKTITACCFENL